MSCQFKRWQPGGCLEVVRITPIYFSHKFRPFGRGLGPRSLGDLRSPWVTTYPKWDDPPSGGPSWILGHLGMIFNLPSSILQRLKQGPRCIRCIEFQGGAVRSGEFQPSKRCRLVFKSSLLAKNKKRWQKRHGSTSHVLHFSYFSSFTEPCFPPP